MSKYSVEMSVSVEIDGDDLNDANNTAEEFMARLHQFIRASEFQGWVSLIEVVDLGESAKWLK